MTTVITFDVDGTLITSEGQNANRLHKLAFAHAWRTVFNFNGDIDEVQHHGMTDPSLLVLLSETHGISKEQAMAKLKELEAAMVAYFEQHRAQASDGLALLPGVREVLLALKARGDVAVGLVTGNLEPIAWGKMQALGLLEAFSEPHFGGFGSDFCSGVTDARETWRDRAELVRIAARRAGETHAGISAHFHVGDTPMDLRASVEGGAQAIGVTTGVFTRADLEECGADATILENLQNLPRVLEAFGLQ